MHRQRNNTVITEFPKSLLDIRRYLLDVIYLAHVCPDPVIERAPQYCIISAHQTLRPKNSAHNMKYELTTSYGWADVTLQYDNDPSVCLMINGLVRERRAEHSQDTASTRIHLRSPAQTAYEYHEFIEGVVEYESDHIIARIIAGNEELLARRVART
ncbi:MAG: hypothetical protein CNE99_05965 [OM182 bacterium MED-G24]|uniref:Uncharacterized protein n=1 Tax=OM182 bacterium MED-G24 TaxID=1986255 RepID=A0A2A5WRR2_9GAMM|nr:MAG: hypothetical protein CNE99_05965 [OM182 bacterium MED-G24]